MNFFKSYIFTWWQVGILKLALIATGVWIGAYWSEVWRGLLVPVAIIAILASLYSMYITLRQIK
jgi:hypothetical protein